MALGTLGSETYEIVFIIIDGCKFVNNVILKKYNEKR